MKQTPSAAGSPRLLATYLWLILAVALLTTAVAVGVTASRPPVYAATGSVLVKPDTSGGAAVLPQMGTERAVAGSAAVAGLAAARLDLSPSAAADHLTATVPVDTDVVELTYTAPSAVEALNGARAFTSAYVEYRNLDLRKPLAQVIGWPRLPAAATPPNYPVVGTLGLLVGLALGTAVAFVWDRLRGRLRGPGDAARVTGAEVLAAVPARADLDDPVRLPAGERAVFGQLAARVAGDVGSMRRGAAVLVTGPRRGAGATTVATHLAVALAALGRDVVLVSGDAGHRGLGLRPGAPGLDEVLQDRSGLPDAVQHTVVPHLRVLTAGGSAAMTGADVDDVRAVVGRLARDAIAVVDAPPVLEAPETSLVGAGCDVTVLVLDVRSGTRADAAAAARILTRLPAGLLGVATTRPRGSRRRGTRAEAPPAKSDEAPLTRPTHADRPDVGRDVAPNVRR